jgi:hypothetical protein
MIASTTPWHYSTRVSASLATRLLPALRLDAGEPLASMVRRLNEWQPEVLPKPSPLFSLPWRLVDVLKYLFAPQGFFWPYNLFYGLLAVISWRFFTPGLDRTAHFQIGWIAEIYARNAALRPQFAEYQEKTTRPIPVVELVRDPS